MKAYKWMIGGVAVAIALAAGVVVSAQPGRPGDCPREGRGGFAYSRPAARIIVDLVELVADEIGMDSQEIAALLRDGLTLEEIIESSGSSLDDLSAVVLAEAEAAIQQGVDNGNLTETRAATLLENLESRWDTLLNHEFGGLMGGGLRDHVLGRIRLTTGDAIVEATGLELADIREQIRNGITLAEIVEANDGSGDAVIALVVAKLTVDIETAVAEGNLTQERADQLLEKLEQHVADVINGEFRARSGRESQGNRGFGSFLDAQGITNAPTDA
jgi:hypothetical protein